MTNNWHFINCHRKRTLLMGCNRSDLWCQNIWTFVFEQNSMSFPNVKCAPLPALGAKFNVPCRYLVFFLSFFSRYSALAFIDLFILVQSWEEEKQEWNKLPICYFASVFVFFLGFAVLRAASIDYICYIAVLSVGTDSIYAVSTYLSNKHIR